MTAFTLESAGLNFKRIPLPESVLIQPATKVQPTILQGDKRIMLHDADHVRFERAFDKSLGFYYDSYMTTHKNAGFHLVIDGDQETLWLNHDAKEIVEDNYIEVKPYAKGTVVISYKQEEMIHHGTTKILVGEGATLNLIKIQNNGSKGQYIDQNLVEVHDRGQLVVRDFQIGSEHMIINYDVNLLGYQSETDMKSVYVAGETKGLDISITANHIGRKSQSEILGKGVLSGQAKKVFRGTLNFEDGSAQSVGKEEEIVLLLSDTVKSDSIPALMCSEDDVIGEHGASVGQVDENQMFYLMSRGLSEAEAKLLIVRSAFAEIVEELEDDSVKEVLHAALERGVSDVL